MKLMIEINCPFLRELRAVVSSPHLKEEQSRFRNVLPYFYLEFERKEKVHKAIDSEGYIHRQNSINFNCILV
jgi:hypothetical protein